LNEKFLSNVLGKLKLRPVYALASNLLVKQGKGKVAKKASKKIYQYDILLEVGVPASEIHRFTDPRHWLHYFPPIAIEDLKKFGISADFRRSFITTDMNKYYDAFIRWQFRTLKAKGKVKFGER